MCASYNNVDEYRVCVYMYVCMHRQEFLKNDQLSTCPKLEIEVRILKCHEDSDVDSCVA